jgi:hypothetical protein
MHWIVLFKIEIPTDFAGGSQYLTLVAFRHV